MKHLEAAGCSVRPDIYLKNERNTFWKFEWLKLKGIEKYWSSTLLNILSALKRKKNYFLLCFKIIVVLNILFKLSTKLVVYDILIILIKRNFFLSVQLLYTFSLHFSVL